MAQSFKPSNYTKRNTPDWAQKTGNIALSIGMAGAAIIAIPMTFPVVLPATLVTVAGYMLGIGTAGKFFLKWFGEDK